MKFKQWLIVLVMILLIGTSFDIYALSKKAAKLIGPEWASQIEQDEKENPLPPKTLIIPRNQANKKLVTSTLNTLLFVKGGSFMMGANPKKVPDQVTPINQPQHKVTLSSYYLMKFFVTFKQYDMYTKLTNGPWIQSDGLRYHDKERTPSYPVQGVNWYQANGYCAYLKKITSLPFSLPTEAQWEYAARSRGRDVEWGTNDGSYKRNVNAGYATPTTIETTVAYQYAVNYFPPNPLGFYEMGDTVPEWVSDWASFYSRKPQTNPQGPKTGKQKVTRGGSIESTDAIGIYSRYFMKPDSKNSMDLMGFRCALNSEQPMSKIKKLLTQQLAK